MIKKYLVPALSLGFLALALSVGLPHLSKSFSGSLSGNVIENVEVYNEAVSTALPEEESLGGVHNAQEAFTGEFTMDAEYFLGSKYSLPLQFASSTPTTSPGGLFTLRNTGKPKICSTLQVDISTAPTGTFVYSVATSSSPFQLGNSNFIVASTTSGTSTAVVISSDQAGHASLKGSWLWGTNDYLLGQFDSDGKSSGAADNVNSSHHASAVGKVYLECHTR